MNLAKLTHRLIVIPIVFVAGSSCLLVLMLFQSFHGEKDAAGINLSGRQRMLNQRHAKETLQVLQGADVDPIATRDLLTESLELLRQGGDHKFGEIHPANDEALIGLLNQKQRQLQVIFRLSDDLMTANRDGREITTEELSSFENEVASGHKLAHAVVLRLSDVAQNSRRLGLATAFGISLVIVLVALVLGNLVVKNLRTRIRSVRQLSRMKLVEMSEQIGDAAASVSNQAKSVSGSAGLVRDNANTLQTTVTHIEESIRDISESASSAVHDAQKAVDAAESTDERISRLGEKSQEINAVVSVINSIAEQTNLLALNATIEAARAGEAGKGFSVVAGQVKELASETGKATEDITAQISDIQSETRDAVDAIRDMNEILKSISSNQDQIATAVNQQMEMTSQIGQNISEVAGGSEQIADNVSYVATLASNATDNSKNTRGVACEIDHLAEELMAMVGGGNTSV